MWLNFIYNTFIRFFFFDISASEEDSSDKESLRILLYFFLSVQIFEKYGHAMWTFLEFKSTF